MPTTFVLDANVLYSARLRDLWLQLAATGVARIAWTDAIETNGPTRWSANGLTCATSSRAPRAR